MYIVHCTLYTVKEVLEQIDVIKQINAKYPETFHYADSAAGIREGFKAGKISSLIGVENGLGKGPK